MEGLKKFYHSSLKTKEETEGEKEEISLFSWFYASSEGFRCFFLIECVYTVKFK